MQKVDIVRKCGLDCPMMATCPVHWPSEGRRREANEAHADVPADAVPAILRGFRDLRYMDETL